MLPWPDYPVHCSNSAISQVCYGQNIFEFRDYRREKTSSVSSRALRPLSYVPILPSEVEQEQRPNGNGGCEAIVVRPGLRDDEGERAYAVYDLILCRERLVRYS